MIKIRPVSTQDNAEWRRLWTAYLKFYQSAVSEEVYLTTFARLTNPELPTQQGLIAERDGKAVGLVHYLFHPHNWRIEDVCYLQDLFIDPDCRGQGIGRALIEAVYDAADANGTPSVYWTTQESNSAARKLYDRIGTLTPFIKYQR